jgi:hypothetical protein
MVANQGDLIPRDPGSKPTGSDALWVFRWTLIRTYALVGSSLQPEGVKASEPSKRPKVQHPVLDLRGCVEDKPKTIHGTCM